MELFDIRSGLALEIKPFKNRSGKGYRHIAPDGSGWADIRLNDGSVKRTVIKGRQYEELKNTLHGIMERNKMSES